MIRAAIHHAAVAVIAVGVLGIGIRSSRAENPSKTLADVGITPRIGASVPADVTLRDENGDEIMLADLLGEKPVILTPVYYRCPMLCGLELNGLVRCLRAMEMTAGQEFRIVTFSIDPKETPELAAEKQANYFAQYGRDSVPSDWRFLTGDAKAIERLCESIGFRAQYDPETGQYAHAAGIVVLTPEGRISRYLFGVEFAPRDLRLAVVDASKGALGTVTDQIMLFCYMYDPTTGKYGLAIMNLVRAAGMMTVLVLAGGVGWMIWREREANALNDDVFREEAAT